ncbi:slit homolog 1 protein-like [Ornithodoros turicata]|uniref:slit homolog 1 protein-like n=1 Tax=Ornithodoros turicata TaxID=34597 RepID=UPI0031387F4D
MFRAVIGAVLLLALEAHSLSTCPRVEVIFPCRCSISWSCRCPEAHCSGIRESPRLQYALVPFANNGLVNLKIDFSHVDFCEDFFPRGIMVHLLRIRNSRLSWNPESKPLEPLADSVEHISLVKCNVPGNWTVFSVLRKLKILEVNEGQGIVPTSLTDVPATLEMLKLTWCKLRDLAPGALAHMSSLRTVYLQGCKLERLRRGVFSGDSLVTLNLQNNRISVVEEGVFDDMPNLLSLDLSSNNIRSLPVDAFRNNPRVSLILYNNPYNCDCSAKWLMRRADDWRLPQCSEPPTVRGKSMSQLQDYFLSC